MIRSNKNHRTITAGRSILRALAACAVLLFAATIDRLPAQQRDPQAEEVARRMMQAMGGEKGWDSIQFVRFDFKVTIGGEVRVNRGHLWDKWSGRYRFEQPTEDGKQQVVLFNVNDKQGSVYVDGEKLDAGAAAEPLKNAYGAYINDMYWLAMPWKWLDSGVNLKYLGEKEREGKSYDVVELTFQQVGLTPGDTYHGYVSKESNLMTYWEYTLQSDNKGAWNWEYGDHQGIKLASDHTNAEGASIHMGDVAVLSEVEDAVFTDPGREIAGVK